MMEAILCIDFDYKLLSADRILLKIYHFVNIFHSPPCCIPSYLSNSSFYFIFIIVCNLLFIIPANLGFEKL